MSAATTHGFGCGCPRCSRISAGTSRISICPLDVQATAFQWRVWQELRKIPYGETRSYSQIAEAVGRPKAVRAVADACAANPAAIVIPCHRVVHENGDTGGYRWGAERKRTLLSREGLAKV